MILKNSFILSIVFILLSGFFFLTPFETSNAQPTSNCCIPRLASGCDDAECEALCALVDGT